MLSSKKWGYRFKAGVLASSTNNPVLLFLQDLVQGFCSEYDRILDRVDDQITDKILYLLAKLKDMKDEAHHLFINFKIPFSNNVSERFIRIHKLKTKTTGSFSSAERTSNFCSIFFTIDTSRKSGGNQLRV